MSARRHTPDRRLRVAVRIASEAYREPGRIDREHAHRDFDHFHYVVSGRGEVTIDGRAYRAEPGALFFYRRGVPHALACDAEDPYRLMELKFSVVQGAFPRLPPYVLVGNPHEITAVFRDIVREFALKRENWEEMLSLLMERLVILIRRAASDGPAGRPPAGAGMNRHHLALVDRATHYVHAYLDRRLSVADVAAFVHLSPSYFAGIFKRATGQSVYDYVLRARIDRVKQMLRGSDDTLTQIAHATGFDSVHHLSKTFKKAEGVPPSSWRAAEQ